MQRITLSVVIGLSALFVGIVLGANVFGETKLFNKFGTSVNPLESAAIHDLHDVSDLTLRVEALIARLEDTESQLQSQQQMLEQLSDDMASLRSDRPTAEAVTQSKAGQVDEVTEGSQQSIGVASFINAGFSPDKAAQLEERYADLELRRLYLRDQALREGWISEPRFGEERAKLNAEEEAIADDLGEDAYDRYLYATGQPNRLSVSSVIRKSPAEENGIKVGDVFYSYAGTRIYNSFDLRNATSDGEAGASVAVKVLRDDSIVQLYIPRGPFGVQLENDSVKP